MSTVSTRIAAAAVLACAACINVDPVRLNLVIVTLDTTRADRLSPYGNMDVSLPHLERLAAEGVVFDQATSVGALTLPAHTSLFTGLLPPVHGVRDNADPPLADRYLTLAEALTTAGYRTGAFVGSAVLGADRGLAQGFGTYDAVAKASTGSSGVERPADAVVSEAARWLDENHRTPFFLWVHLYDPHRPYAPPPPFDSIHDPYVGEIAFADAQIGRLLDRLHAGGLADRTVVVVAGDHGESLGDHGEQDHGIFIYESVLRVPLIVRAPGLAGRRVGDVVRLIDVMPTVLGLLGVAPVVTAGVDLTGLMRGTHRLDLEAYAESIYPRRFGWSALHAIRERRFKFIDAPRPELYDLERDPFETRNLVDERPGLAAAMRARLYAVRGGDRREQVPVSPEVRARLAALGYVSGAGSAGQSVTGPDPKDCIRTSGVRPGRAWSSVPFGEIRCQEEE